MIAILPVAGPRDPLRRSLSAARGIHVLTAWSMFQSLGWVRPATRKPL